jgi:hypothetical protein
MRYFTIKKIEKWCSDKDVAKLIDALNAESPEIRKASILCLGSMGDAVALDALEYIHQNDPDDFVRINAERAIANIRKVGADSRVNIEPGKAQVVYNLNIS